MDCAHGYAFEGYERTIDAHQNLRQRSSRTALPGTSSRSSAPATTEVPTDACNLRTRLTLSFLVAVASVGVIGFLFKNVAALQFYVYWSARLRD